MDLDPALFVSDLQDTNKKLIIFAYYILTTQLHHYTQTKFRKKSQNSRILGFFLLFLLDDEMVPKNLRILRIRNTALKTVSWTPMKKEEQDLDSQSSGTKPDLYQNVTGKWEEAQGKRIEVVGGWYLRVKN